MPEPTQKYNSSHLRACKTIDVSLYGLRVGLLKGMSYPISEHAEQIYISWDGIQLYALACAGAYSKVRVIPSQTMQKNWY